jgi:signal peptidase I
MENSVMAGDRLVVRKTQEIKRGDVFVFNHPNGENVQLVKRCIGLPGDTVRIVRSAIYINDKISLAVLTVRKCPWDFPLDFPLRSLGWDINNYGPVLTPAKGIIVPMDSANMNLYRNVIRLDGHEVSCRDGIFYIDKNPATDYTFRTNSYFVLGDNRGNSLDSRYWGFVPEELVVGRAVMVYFSRDADRRSIRWERIGRRIE